MKADKMNRGIQKAREKKSVYTKPCPDFQVQVKDLKFDYFHGRGSFPLFFFSFRSKTHTLMASIVKILQCIFINMYIYDTFSSVV